MGEASGFEPFRCLPDLCVFFRRTSSARNLSVFDAGDAGEDAGGEKAGVEFAVQIENAFVFA